MLLVVSSEALRELVLRFTPMRNISLNRLVMAAQRRRSAQQATASGAAPAGAQCRILSKRKQSASINGEQPRPEPDAGSQQPRGT